MIFTLITFFAAFSIEALGTYVSVIGLSTLFGANPVIIALAVALDVGKLVVVTLLYTYWRKLGTLMRSYALIAATITMIITSAGTAGYLSGEFQKAILGTQESGLKVDVLKQQIAKYEERKKQIDDQIAAIPEKYTANQRIRLMNQFKAEQQDLQTKIAEIDKKLPELQIAQIGVEAKAGPILYIAKAFDIPVESAVKYVILMIIFVFDPLAVFLIIAGNFLLHQRRLHKETTVTDADLFDETSKLIVPKVAAEPEQIARTFAPRENGDGLIHPTVPIATPIVQFGTPDASDAKVYTTEETIALNPKYAEELQPEVLPELAPIVEEPKAPLFEVLHPTFREPDPERETITLSSLGLVKPDPHTVVDAEANDPGEEVGYKTGVFMGSRPKNS